MPKTVKPSSVKYDITNDLDKEKENSEVKILL